MDKALGRQQSSTDIRHGHAPLEYTKLVVIAAGGVMGLVGGVIGSEMAETASWQSMIANVALMAVAFVCLSALLRSLDLLGLRHRLTAQTRRSEALSEEIRTRLEGRSPGVTDRARQVDASDLVRRALSDESNRRGTATSA